jgi:hypothetical protein
MTDALSRAALSRAVTLSAAVEIQLMSTEGCQPLVALLSKAQDAAAHAITALADVNAEDPQAIRALQNDVRCFDRIVEWLTQIVAEGFDAGDVMDNADRLDLIETLGIETDEGHDVDPTEDR